MLAIAAGSSKAPRTPKAWRCLSIEVVLASQIQAKFAHSRTEHEGIGEEVVAVFHKSGDNLFKILKMAKI